MKKTFKDLFEEISIVEHKDGRVEIECKHGLWVVSGPNIESVRFDAYGGSNGLLREWRSGKENPLDISEQ